MAVDVIKSIIVCTNDIWNNICTEIHTYIQIFIYVQIHTHVYAYVQGGPKERKVFNFIILYYFSDFVKRTWEMKNRKVY